MFNFFLGPPSTVRLKNVFPRALKPFLHVLGVLLLTGLCGCFTMRPLPKVNLSDPGWTIRQGQAVWQPPGPKSPEIAGELLLATRPDGSTFVQFTKTPFPIAIAQTTSNGWQIEFPPQNKRYAAPGKPPARIVWFQLAHALTGKPVAKGWMWHNADDNWQLKNSSGESLEGYFAQ
jgi:hypothetical protein